MYDKIDILERIFLPPEKMEFPEDVLRIIREFSKPLFKYFREYHNARKRFRLIYFPNIKPCLRKNPERILPLLKRLEYWDEEYIRVSNDFQTRYWDYEESGEADRIRETLRVTLDKLMFVRGEICRISYQKN